jgi:hypothetical protein
MYGRSRWQNDLWNHARDIRRKLNIPASTPLLGRVTKALYDKKMVFTETSRDCYILSRIIRFTGDSVFEAFSKVWGSLPISILDQIVDDFISLPGISALAYMLHAACDILNRAIEERRLAAVHQLDQWLDAKYGMQRLSFRSKEVQGAFRRLVLTRLSVERLAYFFPIIHEPELQVFEQVFRLG